ncbi:MAG: deoxyribonuclease IV [Candidatus Omnitrophica bacterium]|nr:deoxyribonuclease IV [Candidatus Omnitrophota bacterium]
MHVPIAGGLHKALAWAGTTGCTTIQIFSRSPRGGKAPPILPQVAADFTRQRLALGIEPLAIHAPYIINLASPEPAKWTWFVEHYGQEYARAVALGATYLVTHVGSHRGEGETEGIARVAAAINKTLASSDGKVIILLENTAGSGQGLGYTVEQLAAIRAGVKEQARVGICLDTAHLFASGYAIHTPEGLEDTIAAFQRAVGMEHLKLIHLNDSKVPFGSRVDRHWHIGKGHIGLPAFRRIVNHPRLQDVPFILETPKATAADDIKNLTTVRRLARSLGPSAPRPRGRA